MDCDLDSKLWRLIVLSDGLEAGSILFYNDQLASALVISIIGVLTFTQKDLIVVKSWMVVERVWLKTNAQTK